MKPRLRSLLFLLCALVPAVAFPPACHAKESAPVAKHIIFIVGDGMQPENEIAASRYLTGMDKAWPSTPSRTGALSPPGM